MEIDRLVVFIASCAMVGLLISACLYLFVLLIKFIKKKIYRK